MNDLISRQAAIDEIEEWIIAFRINGHKESAADACLIRDEIIQLPSVQPEIIRCKDCKHWMMGKTTKNYPNPYICELHSFMHGFERSALSEDYCSWAELRGDLS